MVYRLIILLVMIVFCCGCGRGYWIKGKIVTAVVPDSRYGIYEVTGRNLPAYGDPITQVKITMNHELLKDGSPVKGSVWQESVLSGNDRFFELRDYAAPGNKMLVGLEASKTSYETEYTPTGIIPILIYKCFS